MLEATPALRRCGGAFTGVCDEEIPDMLLRTIRTEPGRKFLYWLTVSPHFPVDPIPIGGTARLCGFSELLREDSYTCALEHRILATLDSIADALNEISDHDVEIIIVGDHAPGFLHPGANDRYSRRQVPTVHLRKQSGNLGLREGRQKLSLGRIGGSGKQPNRNSFRLPESFVLRALGWKPGPEPARKHQTFRTSRALTADR